MFEGKIRTIEGGGGIDQLFPVQAYSGNVSTAVCDRTLLS